MRSFLFPRGQSRRDPHSPGRVRRGIGCAVLGALGLIGPNAAGAASEPGVVFGVQVRRQRDGADAGNDMGAYARQMAETVARAAQLSHRIKEYGSWPELEGAFQRGEVDVLAMVTRAPEREGAMLFTVPHMRSTISLFGRSGTPVPRKLEEIGTRRIVVQDRSIAHYYLLRQPWAAQIIAKVDIHEAIEDVVEARADFWLNNTPLGNLYLREAGMGDLVVPLFSLPGEISEVCMAVRPDQTELLARLNLGLTRARQHGEIQRIYDEWSPLFEGHWLPRRLVWRWAIALVFAALAAWVFQRTRLRRARLQMEKVQKLVTERTRELAASAEQLRAAEELQRRIWEQARDGLRLTDEQGVVLRVNNAYCQIVGLTRGQLEGQPLSAPCVAADRQHVLDRFRRRFAAKSIEGKLEREVKLENGRTVWLEVSNSILERSGAPALVLSIVRDITARKTAEQEQAKLQERLFQSQKQEALGALAGGVAHDFNNILTVIMNYIVLAQEEMAPAMGREYLAEVLTAGKRASELVRQILLYCRAEEPHRVPLEWQSIVKEGLVFLRSALPPSVVIESRIDDRASTVLADSLQLHQIVVNLAINAADAMDGKPGRLIITVAPITIDSARAEQVPNLRAGDYVQLEVSDTGEGMTPAVMGRIFEPFFTTKQIGRGTGLGLSVVQGIVRAHDGAITVRSAPGMGSTFTVYLPRHWAAVAPPPPAADDVPLGKGEQILLVDDEAAVAQSMRLLLECLQYQVTICGDADAALASVAGNPAGFAVILTDYRMPGMNGLVLAAKIRERDARVPILMASGFSDGIGPQDLRRHGIAELIEKPIEYGPLARTLGRVIAASHRCAAEAGT